MTTLIINSQFKQFDENGVPLAAGKIYTHIVGTTTDKVTYQDEAKVAAHDNPIILDSWGEQTIWIDGDTKFVVTDSNDVPVRTYPSFEDGSTPTGETPIVVSPDGAVYRSSSTDTGYIKIQLPMGEWPNTKMMFDVDIYEDVATESYKLTLGGYASSLSSSWENTTAITNGKESIAVQFGNDGTYPCVYIGAVSSQWTRPQIAVSNFLAGEFSYAWDTWNDGWAISITTTLGTITATPDTYGGFATEAVTITGTSEILKTNPLGVKAAIDSAIGLLTGAWADVVFGTGYVARSFGDSPTTVQYRLIEGGASLQIQGGCEAQAGSTPLIFTLPAGFRPIATHYGVVLDAANVYDTVSVAISGEVNIGLVADGSYIYFNHIIPLT